MCCIELQCDALSCNVMQCAAVRCSVLQCVAVCHAFSAMKCVAGCCRLLQVVAGCCSVLQCVAVCCSVLRWHVACCNVFKCSVLQRTSSSITPRSDFFLLEGGGCRCSAMDKVYMCPRIFLRFFYFFKVFLFARSIKHQYLYDFFRLTNC